MKKYIFLVLIAVISYSIGMEAQNNNKSEDNTVTFYFTRHGKTILNTMDRVQGWADAPLTPAGVEVAEFLGKGLKAEDIIFTSAYSSDLGRAKQTAKIVLEGKGQGDLVITELPQMRETNFGSYEGEYNSKMWNDAALYLHYKSQADLMKDLEKNPEKMKDIVNTFKELETLEIGEDYNTVKTRGQNAIRKIAAKEAANGGGNVLLVGHGMSLGIFLSDLDDGGKKPDSGHMGNAAVCKVTYKDGKFKLESFGDMSYVEKGKALSEKIKTD